MIRHIEQWSKADLAYDNAFEAAVSSSLGYLRVTTEYADDEGFDQELCIRPIDNAFSVYDDPDYTCPTRSDRKWCFVTEWVDRDEFEEQYGFEALDIAEAARATISRIGLTTSGCGCRVLARSHREAIASERTLAERVQKTSTHPRGREEGR
jgi:hypothetical protein